MEDHDAEFSLRRKPFLAVDFSLILAHGENIQHSIKIPIRKNLARHR